MKGPIFVRLLGSISLLKDIGYFEFAAPKESVPVSFTPFSSVRQPLKPEQLKNAPLPIFVTPAGIVKSPVSLEHW